MIRFLDSVEGSAEGTEQNSLLSLPVWKSSLKALNFMAYCDLGILRCPSQVGLVVHAFIHILTEPIMSCSLLCENEKQPNMLIISMSIIYTTLF
jgi:hypothetical protein